jgi:hypothetical protein
MDFVKLENRQEILDYLFLNFKIISQVKEGQKLKIRNFNGLDILDIDNRLIYKYLRGFYGDNRDNTINLIKNIVELAYKVTDEILNEEFERYEQQGNHDKNMNKSPFDTDDDNSLLFRKLVSEMGNSLIGLENLRLTYIDDVSITSIIGIIVGKINLRINKINSLLKISKR